MAISTLTVSVRLCIVNTLVRTDTQKLTKVYIIYNLFYLCESDKLYTSWKTAEFKCITWWQYPLSVRLCIVNTLVSIDSDTQKLPKVYTYDCFNYVHHQINYIHHELCITWWQYISAFSRVVYCKHSCKCKHW